MENEDHPQPNTPSKSLIHQQQKATRDKGRKRTGKSHKKRVPLLMHPKVKAFLGWRNEPEPWTYETVNKYVDWCHINKLFPFWRHKAHVDSNKANVGYCKNEDFKQRCCEVWMKIYTGDGNFRSSKVSFFLVQMVYAEVVLKKEVDWRTIKQLQVGSRPDVATIPRAEVPAALKLMLTTVKPKKLPTPDEAVVWSANSSSDEHTHEYDGYSFHSDDEDNVTEELRKNLELEAERKGKKKVEEPQTLSNIHEHGMDDVEAMEVDDVHPKINQSGSVQNLEDDLYMLSAQIESARAALHETNADLRKLEKNSLAVQANRQVLDKLKQDLEWVTIAIQENEKFLRDLMKKQDFYRKKKADGRGHIMDDYVILETKHSILDRERLKLQSERQALIVQIQEKEKEYLLAATEDAEELDVLALAPEYGSTPEEIATLQKLLKLHEKKIEVAKEELLAVLRPRRFHKAWFKWNKGILGATRAELERKGPPPQQRDF